MEVVAAFKRPRKRKSSSPDERDCLSVKEETFSAGWKREDMSHYHIIYVDDLFTSLFLEGCSHVLDKLILDNCKA